MTRPTTKASIREKLLIAALPEFAAHGYKGASLRRICGEAGVALGNVGHIFGGKHDLLRVVWEGLFDPLNDRRLRALEKLQAVNSNPGIVELFESSNAPWVEFMLHEDWDIRGRFAVRSALEHEAFWPMVARDIKRAGTAFPDAVKRALPDSPDEALGRWRTASQVFFFGLMPTFRNVAVPTIVSREEVARLFGYAVSVLLGSPELDLESSLLLRTYDETVRKDDDV